MEKFPRPSSARQCADQARQSTDDRRPVGVWPPQDEGVCVGHRWRCGHAGVVDHDRCALETDDRFPALRRSCQTRRRLCERLYALDRSRCEGSTLTAISMAAGVAPVVELAGVEKTYRTGT